MYERSGGLARGLAVAAALLLLVGCSREVTVRGNMPDPDVVATITPGVSTRAEVANALGSPSTLSSFSDRTWYYIGQKQTQFAFMNPNILERTVLEVVFDDADVVQETKVYNLEHGQEVTIVSRETPTEGRQLTILQQLFGNLGRFPTSTPGTQ